MTDEKRYLKKRIEPPDLRDVAALHAQASKKLGLLQDEYQALLETGTKGQAKAALQRVEKIRTVVRAIEARVKETR